MSELVFEVTQESDGGYVAEAPGEDIFTQGDTWDELKSNIQDVVKGFYFDGGKPSYVRLRLRKDGGPGCRVKIPRNIYGRDLADLHVSDGITANRTSQAVISCWTVKHLLTTASQFQHRSPFGWAQYPARRRQAQASHPRRRSAGPVVQPQLTS